jgi:hypothetical protein
MFGLTILQAAVANMFRRMGAGMAAASEGDACAGLGDVTFSALGVASDDRRHE